MDLFRYTYDLVKQIPEGMVSTYGSVALALGDIRASRAVGRMMNQNPDPDSMPCFRIVYSDGKLGGFGRGVNDKIRRLKEDGIKVENGEIVNFEKILFTDFDTDFPLKKLRKKQLKIREKIILDDAFQDDIKSVAGFDVAYPRNAFDDACASIIIMDYNKKKIVEKQVVFDKIFFPYIPTYLSFREFPFVKKLMEKIDFCPDVLMFDGNGILHPYHVGIASHAGVLLDVPSVGVAKNLLCGDVKNGDVLFDEQIVGKTFFANERIKNPVYVSTGHRVSLKNCVDIVKNLSCFKNPEPLRLAHKHATETLKKQK
jgi:deoxyribonuclease V